VEKLLLAANSGLALSILVMLGCVAIAYPLAEHFSMAAQIAAHIAMLIFALGIKVSYITRLVALKELGRALH
jgi:ABC-type spermidine/putrescine transport system permease subunit I